MEAMEGNTEPPISHLIHRGIVILRIHIYPTTPISHLIHRGIVILRIHIYPTTPTWLAHTPGSPLITLMLLTVVLIH